MSVEDMVMAIKQLSLKILAPRIRTFVVVLESLLGENRDSRDIRVDCMRYGFTCRGLEHVLKELEENDIVFRDKNGRYSLTEYGEDLAKVMQGIYDDIEEFIEKSHQGTVDIQDVYSLLFTPVASVIGLAEAELESDDMVRALGLTTYLTVLISATLSLLSSNKSELRELIRRIEREFSGVE